DSTPEIDAEIDQAFIWGGGVFAAEAEHPDPAVAKNAKEVLDYIATLMSQPQRRDSI
ncbi:MAG: hypothetical protein JWO82_401, partial [Akkermansiaceae bacterium]|nr:hypothetical protein [Akkermansiaceae bacterium]